MEENFIREWVLQKQQFKGSSDSDSSSSSRWRFQKGDLKGLLVVSRQQESREVIGEMGLIESLCWRLKTLLEKISQTTTTLGEVDGEEIEETVMILRGTSNLCANCPANQEAITRHPVSSSFVSYLLGTSRDTEVNHFVVQLISNAITLNSTTQQLLWSSLFPSVFRVLFERLQSETSVPLDTRLLTKSLVLLYNFVRPSLERQKELVHSPEGHFISRSILQLVIDSTNNQATQEEYFDWIYFLIELLFFSELLPTLYSNFKAGEPSSSPFGLLSSSQLTLLKLLDAIIDTIHSATEDRDPSGRPKVGSNYKGKLPFDSCAFFVSELSRLWTLKRKLQQTTSSSSSSSSLSARASMELDESIFLLLQMLGTITAFEESGLRDVLQSHGIISTSIDMLRTFFTQDKESTTDFDVPPLTMDEYSMRRYIIRILANMSYLHKESQDQVRNLEGITLLLNHCNLDEKNPYIREWSILAIRNLMEGNEENQEYVKGMQLQGAVPSQELSEMGLEAQVINGKIRVSRRGTVPPVVEEMAASDSSAAPVASTASPSSF